MASLHFRLYIFFHYSFVVSISSPFFDPKVPFDGIPLYMVHQAAAPPQPSPPASMESDPSKTNSSFSAAFSWGGKGHPLGNLRAAGILVNGFHTPELD